MLCKVGGGRREWMGVPFRRSGSTARYRFVVCGWMDVRHPGGVGCWLVLCHTTRCCCCTLPSCGEWRRGVRRGRWYYLGAARRRRRRGWITEPPLSSALCPRMRPRFPPLPIPPPSTPHRRRRIRPHNGATIIRPCALPAQRSVACVVRPTLNSGK